MGRTHFMASQPFACPGRCLVVTDRWLVVARKRTVGCPSPLGSGEETPQAAQGSAQLAGLDARGGSRQVIWWL